MNASSLLEDLRRRDVILEAEGDLLNVDAPAGAITDDLRTALVENKVRLLKLLARERQKLEKAGRRGLAIRWSEYPTWIALHDPSTGEWHEWPAADCFQSMVAEANRHRQKRGRRG